MPPSTSTSAESHSRGKSGGGKTGKRAGKHHSNGRGAPSTRPGAHQGKGKHDKGKRDKGKRGPRDPFDWRKPGGLQGRSSPQGG